MKVKFREKSDINTISTRVALPSYKGIKAHYFRRSMVTSKKPFGYLKDISESERFQKELSFGYQTLRCKMFAFLEIRNIPDFSSQGFRYYISDVYRFGYPKNFSDLL